MAAPARGPERGPQRTALRALLREDLKIGRARVLRNRFRTFWEYRYPSAATSLFTLWFLRATHSRLARVAAVAKLPQRHVPNPPSYLRYHLTKAGVKSINAAIQCITTTARGFRETEHSKTTIYFHYGGLHLYPHDSI